MDGNWNVITGGPNSLRNCPAPCGVGVGSPRDRYKLIYRKVLEVVSSGTSGTLSLGRWICILWFWCCYSSGFSLLELFPGIPMNPLQYIGYRFGKLAQFSLDHITEITGKV